MGFFPTLIIRQVWGKHRSSVTSLGAPFSKSSSTQKFSLFCRSVIKSYSTLCDPWTVARQAPLSMGFPRQESWSGLPFPSPGVLPYPRTESSSHVLAGRFFFFFFYHWAIREAPEVLWTPSVKVFMEASLHRCDWLNHWPLVINSDSSSFHPRPPTLSGDGVRRGGACWKFQPSKETSLLPISSILRGCPKVRSLT